jgi:Putative transmembrane protein (PGPGW).
VSARFGAFLSQHARHRFAHGGACAHSGDVPETQSPAGDAPPTGEATPPGRLASLAARAPWRRLPHPLRWLTVALIGGTFIVVGIALLVLPGPGIAFIVLGLAILATEFVWAETLLHRVKDGGKRGLQMTRSMVRGRRGTAATPPDC